MLLKTTALRARAAQRGRVSQIAPVNRWGCGLPTACSRRSACGARLRAEKPLACRCAQEQGYFERMHDTALATVDFPGTYYIHDVIGFIELRAAHVRTQE